MRITLLALLVCLSGTATAAQFISIGDVRFLLAYAPPESPVHIREYLPAGQTLDKWTQLASVRTFADLNDPAAYLQGLAKKVAGSDPNARAQLLQNADKSVMVLDFLVFSPATAPVAYAEWNLMRARYEQGKGLIVYQYARRFYNPDAAAGKQILAEREKMLTPFSTATFAEASDSR